MSTPRFRRGDRVIFRRGKVTPRPGPRAERIEAEPRGEYYHYDVDKFWIVEQVRDDGTLVLLTRRGKRHEVAADNPRLRRANWWERIWWIRKFPKLVQDDSEHEPS
jgi:hypothetical protein